MTGEQSGSGKSVQQENVEGIAPPSPFFSPRPAPRATPTTKIVSSVSAGQEHRHLKPERKIHLSVRNLERGTVVHRVKEVCQLLFFLPFLLPFHLKDRLSHIELHNSVEWRVPSFRPEEQGKGVQG